LNAKVTGKRVTRSAPPKVETVSKPPDYHPHTDQGNAQRFIDAYGATLRYDHSGQSQAECSWYAWKKDRWWEPVGESAVFRAAVNLVNKLRNSSDSEAFTAWMHTTESGYHFREMINRASMMNPIAVERPSWNSDPMLFAVENGVIDLRTGELRKGKPSDQITFHSPITFDAAATSPVFDKFLYDVLCKREDLVKYILKAGGYSMTGLTTERCLFILYGSGGNGKSKLIDILDYIFGTYAKTTPASTLSPSRGGPDAPRNDLARLAGARFVSASESELRSGMAEAMVKWLTGSDKINARYGHGRPFEYKPELKLWLSCNHRPPVKGTDQAIWDRLPLIPFEAEFKGERDDKGLIDKLKAEAPGILNRLIQGCLDWQREGLTPQPDCVRAASTEYRTASNPIAPFLESCCDYNLDSAADSTDGDSFRKIHDAYITYMNRMREKPDNIFEFGAQMRSFGFGEGKRNNGKERYWRGVSLKIEPDFQVEDDDGKK